MSRRALAALLLAIAPACGGDGPGPTDQPEPGVVRASLTTPNTTDGALLIRIVGELSNLEAVGGYRVASTAAGTTTRLVLTGNLAGGDLLRFSVPDKRKISSYLVVVEQVAARDTYALIDPAGYAIVLRTE